MSVADSAPVLSSSTSRPSAFSTLLVITLVVALLLGAWWVRDRPEVTVADRQAALITDGCVDRDQRRVRLQHLLDLGERELAAGSVEAGVLAAAAALDLGDRAAWDRIVAAVAGRSPWLPAPVDSARVAATGAAPWSGADHEWLGAPYLVSLFSGVASAKDGDLTAARSHFESARDSARWSGAELVAETATRLGGLPNK